MRKKFVSFSGGKDSLVTLHKLLYEWNKNFEVIYVDTGLSLPECNEYVKEICEEFGVKLNVIKAKRNFWETVEQWGFPTRPGWKRWCMMELKMKPLKEFIPKFSVVALGIRKGESSYRKKFYQETIIWSEYLTAWEYFPILEWSNEDIERYIEKYKLKVNPCYKLYGFGGNCYFCPFRVDKKYYLRLRLHHPELFKKIIEYEAKMRNKTGALYKQGKNIYVKDMDKQVSVDSFFKEEK